MNATATHSQDCECVPCMLADMDAAIEANGLNPQEYRDGRNGEGVQSVRTRYLQPGDRVGNGVVRLVSEAQVRFIKKLMNERDTTNLVRLPGSENIEQMSLRGARDLIDRLLACPMKPNQPTVPMATDAQVKYILSLVAQKDVTGIDVPGNPTKAQASEIIGKLKAAPFKPQPKVEVKEITGIYELDGKYYRMQKARSGEHFYAKVLDRDAGDAWIFAEGMSRKVPAQGRKLTLEECEALSLALGSCCICGRTLEATVDGVGPGARFIGPKCSAKMGY